jgi:hypothetical protein
MWSLLLLLTVGDAAAQSEVPRARFGQDIKGERQGGPFGLGVSLGAPTGLAGKVWFGDWMGVQFGVGGDLGWPGDFAVTTDYVVHIRPFETGSPEYSVPLYFGGGINLSTNTSLYANDIFFGPRLVGGANVLVRALPIDLFVEVAPTFLVVAPTPTWSFDGAMGVRYYF